MPDYLFVKISYFPILIIALAVFIRSPAAYDALKSFSILQLPSKQSLKQFSSTRNHESGINEQYIMEMSADYKLFAKETVSNGYPAPLGVGALIFDEVKVMAKVVFNVKNEKCLGLAMSLEEMKGLHDIFHDLGSKAPIPAEYVLQYLWRDLTSNFDVIGPYFTLGSTIDHTVVTETIFKVMKAFHDHGFKTRAIVCDGASANLAAIKLICNQKRGAFGITDNKEDPFRVNATFFNPMDNKRVSFVICPSHQVCMKSKMLGSSSTLPGVPEKTQQI